MPNPKNRVFVQSYTQRKRSQLIEGLARFHTLITRFYDLTLHMLPSLVRTAKARFGNTPKPNSNLFSCDRPLIHVNKVSIKIAVVSFILDSFINKRWVLN